MTRFARAKGSKSSNVRTPEDSTPWEVMKEQLLKNKQGNEDNKKREEAEQQRITNYENFLKERKVEKRKAEWCDFPEAKSNQSLNLNHNKSNKNKKIKKAEQLHENVISETLSNSKNAIESEHIVKKKKNKHKNRKQSEKEQNDDQKIDDSTPSNNPNTENSEKKNKKIKNKKQSASNISNSNDTNKATEDSSNVLTHTKQSKKKNKSRSKIDNSQISTPSLNDQEKQNSNPKDVTVKKKKMFEKPSRRKPINDKSFQLIINTKEVELVRFDGFPIMKKDAERLQELKNSMIKKGIPKSEVQRTIKLERRRAEKALARLKRDVCYNCRKGGHNLSDCPDLKSNIPGVDSADGVCFKCGSTEHRQNECKVQKDKEFRFATCFICRETGHLARQCPDNPKGLYPNGGCCKLCGDVTHLRKDCPTVKDTKEETSIKLPTLDSVDNIEDITQHTPAATVEHNKKPKKVKF
ncbi:zinc finger CCHC domain-containing protein 9-like [Leptidea sinapis]|uniref:zinc finger CCHC domain-containing protein 9-like n=1 Tax=Leptidea sinapis TaxID=189913 RepID=UPI002145E6A0|nr:zinc finger CCHC domain-containing protein 9-like [Leptidea sinapis]